MKQALPYMVNPRCNTVYANAELAVNSPSPHNALITHMITQEKQGASVHPHTIITAEKEPLPSISPARAVEYFGNVNYATTERIIEKIRSLMWEDTEKEIYLTVTSAGGPTGTAMSFYDQIRYVLRPNLVTIGSGDVDSSGIIIFLAGERRFVTKNTTLLFHSAGRTFEGGKRVTAAEMDTMIREDNLKDFQYASVVAERSHKRLTTDDVLELMKANTIMTPIELVNYGLADRVLE